MEYLYIYGIYKWNTWKIFIYGNLNLLRTIKTFFPLDFEVKYELTMFSRDSPVRTNRHGEKRSHACLWIHAATFCGSIAAAGLLSSCPVCLCDLYMKSPETKLSLSTKKTISKPLEIDSVKQKNNVPKRLAAPTTKHPVPAQTEHDVNHYFSSSGAFIHSV